MIKIHYLTLPVIPGVTPSIHILVSDMIYDIINKSDEYTESNDKPDITIIASFKTINSKSMDLIFLGLTYKINEFIDKINERNLFSIIEERGKRYDYSTQGIVYLNIAEKTKSNKLIEKL